MGLSTNEIAFLAAALKSGLIPGGMRILELGESEPAPEGTGPALLARLKSCVPAARMAAAKRRMAAAMGSVTQYQQQFGPARALYHAIFDPSAYVAIDLDPGPRKYRLDLNHPVSLGQRFDCVINNGTSEHIFDQAGFFRFMHDHTEIGGLMIHWTPCIGWLDHGLYNVQPSFFFELAFANGYEVRLIGLASQGKLVPLPTGDAAWGALNKHPQLGESMICALLRKTREAPFAAASQGMFPYSDEALEAARRQHRVVPAPGPNLALNRPALQSSTCEWSWDGDPAVDAAGGNDGVVTGACGFHTDQEDEPWWQVDLGDPRPLAEVVIYNCLETPDIAARAARLAVALSDDGIAWRPVFRRNSAKPFGGADGKPLRVALNGEAARFLRILLPDGGWLHLDEVEVYGAD